MTPTPEKETNPQVSGWVLMSLAVAVGVTGSALGSIGLALSFLTVKSIAAALGMPGDPALYPIAVDVGILAFLGGDLLFVYLNRPLWFLRPLAWILTGFTVWANFHGGASDAVDTAALARIGMDAATAHHVQAGLHVVMPTMWVVLLEALRSSLLRGRRRASGQTSTAIPVVRWLLSPIRTVLLYRRMRLWGVESYQLALALEAARLHGIDIVRARLDGRWRRLAWRWNIPRLLRNDLTSGNMPDDVIEVIAVIVESGKRTGWRRAVHWWVAGEMDRTEDVLPVAAGDAADGAVNLDGQASEGSLAGDVRWGLRSAPVGALSGASGGALGTGPGGPSAPALEGGLRRGPGGPSKGLSVGASEGASNGASGGASKGASGAPSGGVSGGASKGARRTGSKTSRRTAKAAGADDRIPVRGMDDEEIIAQYFDEMDLEYRGSHDGDEMSPTFVTKRLAVNHYKAKRLLAAYYKPSSPGEEGTVVPLASNH